MYDKGVYRTAPATTCLLTIALGLGLRPLITFVCCMASLMFVSVPGGLSILLTLIEGWNSSWGEKLINVALQGCYEKQKQTGTQAFSGPSCWHSFNMDIFVLLSSYCKH